MRRINIYLEEHSYSAKWKKYDHEEFRIWIRGNVFYGDRIFRDESAVSLLLGLLGSRKEKKVNADQLLFSQLNGFFTIIIEGNQGVYAAVDRVRSIPLFYGQTNDRVFLSNDAEWIRNNVGDTEMDPLARQEFLQTGYVTGSDTLLPNVKQLQAGECLLITKNQDKPQLQTHRYYRFLHTEPKESVDQDYLFSELNAVCEKSIRRLIDYADGRQIVVPLSSGLDSRLIVTLLRRLGYENVLTFSYGTPENHESRVSKAVAESLNYPWEFIKYSNSLWRTWWLSQEMRSYEKYASQWTSLPVIQDWPAVMQLKQEDKLEKHAVFAPGHSADLPAGSRSRLFPEIYDSNSMDTEQVLAALIKMHYSLQPSSNEEVQKLKERILAMFQIATHENKASAFEEWDVLERQAKFIINSIRAYEFWGYDWYLPFWDRDFMIFWQNVPVHLRRNKVLYDKYVNQTFRKQCGDLIQDSATSDKIGRVVPASLRAAIKGSFLAPFLKLIYRFPKVFVDYYTHPLAWYGIQDLVTHMKVRPNNINSMLALLYIRQKTASFPQ